MERETACRRLKFSGTVRYVYKQMGKALAQFDMLSHKDRILVAVSGGIASLSLLKLFLMRKKRIPIEFEILACFLDGSFIEVNKQIMRDYIRGLGINLIEYRMEDKNNIETFWCSWERRNELRAAAQEYGCNKIALAHTMDDVVQSRLLYLFFYGKIDAVKPHIIPEKGEIEIIRPLCFLPAAMVRQFAFSAGIPRTGYTSHYGQDERLKFVNNIITQLEGSCAYVKKNIFNAVDNIKEEYLV